MQFKEKDSSVVRSNTGIQLKEACYKAMHGGGRFTKLIAVSPAIFKVIGMEKQVELYSKSPRALKFPENTNF